MNSQKKIGIYLIVRFLSGESSSTEQEHLEAWINQSDENKKTFENYKTIWELQPSEISLKINTPEAWKKVEMQLDITALKAAKTKKIRPIYYLSTIAATVLLLIGFYFVKVFNQNNQIEYYASQNISEPIILSDSSRVFINSGSKISLPKNFDKKKRIISLSGEAFFEVTPDSIKPFFVRIGDVEAKVLGTSFNIADQTTENTIKLSVLTGIVALYHIDHPEDKIILTKDEVGVYDKFSGKITKEPIENQNFLAWKTKVLEFDQTPLTEVIYILEKTYNISIFSEINITELKLTARFSNETPEDIFKTLKMVYGFEFEQKNSAFIIKL
jgi:transmembrane sensor